MLSIIEKIDKLNHRLEIIEESIPTWIAISRHLALQYGYTTDGFRKYLLKNLNPLNEFKKFGGLYHIHKSALLKIRKKV